jgi:hypothetical protein
VYWTPVPDIDTLKARIRDALAAVTEEMLEKTWSEIEYRLYVKGEDKDIPVTGREGP